MHLASADLPKDGGRFDPAIALGILSASVQVPAYASRRILDVSNYGHCSLYNRQSGSGFVLV